MARGVFSCLEIDRLAMMAPPGQALANPGQMQNLRSALGQTAPPNNPNTPNQRLDPQERRTLDMQRIHRALERAIEPYDGGPSDATTDIFHMFHGVVTRIMSGIDPMQAFMKGVQAIVPSPMPAAASQGAVPQASAGPTPPPSLLQGMQGPVPVSPGLPAMPTPPG
jgi:hypothetical protein